MLMQSKPGDLFIMRNAGNIIPPYGPMYTGEAGTIEFAVAALGIKDIIICGHSHCGAMKGVLKPEAVKEMPAVAGWLKHAESTQKIMQENYAELEGEPKLNAAIQENVLAQIENIKTHPIVAARMARGELNLHGWVYKFETGEVFAYDGKEEVLVVVESDSRRYLSSPCYGRNDVIITADRARVVSRAPVFSRRNGVSFFRTT